MIDLKSIYFWVWFSVFSVTTTAQVSLNGSFELTLVDPQDSYIELFAGDDAITHWIIDNGSVDIIKNLWQASDQSQSIDLNGLEPGIISQSFSTLPGNTYQVRFDLAGNPQGSPMIKNVNVSVADYSADFEFDITGFSNQNMGWKTINFYFIAKDTQSTLKFSSLVSGNAGAVIDGVQVIHYSDCLGQLDGNAFVDQCGKCLLPTDPALNLSCKHIYIPNVFSPNNDGINDQFILAKHPELEAQIRTYKIFNRWGGLIYESGNFSFLDTLEWWDGTLNGRDHQNGVYVYFIEVVFADGTTQNYEGSISVLR